MPDEPGRGAAKTIHNALHGVADINGGVPVSQIENQFLVIPQPVSELRDVVVGGGSASYNGDEYVIEAAAGQDLSFETSRIGVYHPGTISDAGIRYRLPSDTPGNTFEAGLGRSSADGDGTVSRNDDEIFIRHDPDGTVSFVNRKDGVETVVPQSEWGPANRPTVIQDENGDDSVRVHGHDRVNGAEDPENPSNYEIDPTNGVLMVIKYAWYGTGPMTLHFAGYDQVNGQFGVWPAVTLEPLGRTPISQPNQPIFGRVLNGDGSTSQQAFVAGRQYSTEGEAVANRRSTSHFRRGFTIASKTGTGPASTDSLVVLFRRKPNSADAGENYSGVELGISNVQIFLEQRSYVYVTVNPDLAGTPTWESPSQRVTDQETALQVATDGDPDPTTGTLYDGTLYGSGKNDSTLAGGNSLNFPTPRTKPVGLFAYSVTGQDDSGVEANVKFEETR